MNRHRYLLVPLHLELLRKVIKIQPVGNHNVPGVLLTLQLLEGFPIHLMSAEGFSAK
jgi:hypothetical protein